MGIQRKKEKIRKSLIKKGFQADEDSNHTKLIYRHQNQVEAIFTILSRGEMEYHSNLLGKMARQL